MENGSYHVITFGCQMNLRDSETLSGMLEAMRYTPTDNPAYADIIIINTCCVRENAENKAFAKIGDMKRLKLANPSIIIGVCGCMAQEPDKVQRIKESYPHVDLIFGTHNIHRLPLLLRSLHDSGSGVCEVWDEDGSEIVEGLPAIRKGRFHAWVNIMYGCNNYCTYCIVPYTRGRERSRSTTAILEEINGLNREGFREITLLGQNVNSYGKDSTDGVAFPQLLRLIDREADREVGGIQRIRYTTSHPRDFSDELIAAVADCDRVCDHFHLPLQAGAETVLAKMNRGYSAKQYQELVRRIREKNPGCSITTDIIVGFPGETNEDFTKTLEVVSNVRFDSAFMFAYSARIGTPAADFPHQVPLEERLTRLYALIELQNRISREVNESYRGRTVEVLVEGLSETNDSMLSGRTSTNKLCLFPKPESAKDMAGQLVPVVITEPKSWTLHGKLATG